MPFQSGQSARSAHTQLVAAVKTMNEAEHCAVLWFADIGRRKLYRELGYSSMNQYATVALKFSKTRANDFLRLARRLEELPAVRRSVASGELGYTKAREIIRVASPKTEHDWLAAAATMTRKDLEKKVARVRKRAMQRKNTAQVELLTAPREERAETKLATTAPVRIGMTVTAEQAARYEALWQRLGTAPNPEDLLEALVVLADQRSDAIAGTSESATQSKDDSCAGTAPRGAAVSSRPPVQIHVHQCPDCGATEANGRQLDRADCARVACDAAIATPDRRNSTTIPPRTRRNVLARDRHRCQAPGCAHTRFLEVHHVVSRAQGGSNDAENLITLCAACHRLWYERGLGWQRPLEKLAPPPTTDRLTS